MAHREAPELSFERDVKLSRKPVLGIRITPTFRFVLFAAVDAMLLAASLLFAVVVRYDGMVPLEAYRAYPIFAAVSIVSTIAALHAVGVYRIAWSFVGLRDIARVAAGVGVSVVFLAAFFQFAYVSASVPNLPRSVAVIFAPIAFCALSGFRLARRAVRTLQGHRLAVNGPRTLLIGAGVSGSQILRSIQATGAPYQVVGFLDDDPRSKATVIHGVRVLGPTAELERHIRLLGVEVAIVCVASATSPFVRDIVRRCHEAGVDTIRIVPSVAEIVEGQVDIQTTREVRLEDLLGREAVVIDSADVRALLSGKRVVITGGAGTIGAELCRQIARFKPASLVVLDVDETRIHDVAAELTQTHPQLLIRQALVDVRDEMAVRELFMSERPQVVFHAAAYKHVPMMEAYPLAAMDVNVLGTSNVLDAAEASGAERFVLISTDKAVEPSSIMGATKRLAELVVFARPHVASKGARKSQLIRSAVRFGNVIGSRGSVIPTFERQLRQGGPLTVTHPQMERFFMMTSEAVSLVLQAAALGEGNDLFVLDMGKPVNILQVAREFVRLHGLHPDRDIEIIFTGLRPGEKLVERLNYADEQLVPTKHARVLRTSVQLARHAPPTALVRQLVDSRDPAVARAALRELFPSLETFANAATEENPMPAA